MTEYRPPKAPVGLRAQGRRLWLAVTGSFECRPDELVVLDKASRLADHAAVLERALKHAETEIEGSKGQRRVNGLFAELRSTYLALARLLQQLGLEDAREPDASARSTAGRRMARLRWR